MTTETVPANALALPLGELSAPQALMLAREVAADLGWPVTHLSAAGLMAQVPAAPDEVAPRLMVLLYANGILVSSPEEAAAAAGPPRHVEVFARLYVDKLPLARGAALQEQYEQARPTFVPPAQDVLAPPASGRTASEWLALLRPRRGYLTTPLLLDACLLVFLLMALSGANVMRPAGADLLAWGANHGPLTLAQGQWWRLLSSAFVHIGVLHLLFNLYALLNIGLLLEPRIGPLRLGLAYLLTAAGGSLASLWWHDYTVSAGASGAIFGLYGVFLALLTTSVVEAEVRRPLLSSIGAFVVYNLMFGLIGNIDNAAHLGGLLSGVLVGYGLWPGLRPGVSLGRQQLLTAALTLGLIVGAGLIYRHLPNHWGKYQATMQRIGNQEAMALKVLNLPPGAPREQQLYGLQERGIRYWEQNLQLLRGLDSLRLPQEAKEHNAVLRHYSQLRLRSYQLRYRALAENSPAYTDSIRAYEQQIEAIIRAQQAPQP